MTPDEYREYLRSPWWQARRRRAIQEAGHRCQACGVYWTAENPIQLQVHHKTYVRVGRERLSDLEVLCRACHEGEHGVPEGDRTTPGPEPIGAIANRVLHFAQLRKPQRNAG